MADIELVIKIPSEVYENIKSATADDNDISSLVLGIHEATPLPKGHDRLIEANSVDKIVKSIEPSDAEWGMTAETAIRLIHDAFDRAPTIIEADKESEE